MDVTVEQVVNVATSIVATASVITSVFPVPKANPYLIAAHRILNIFAINLRHAKNAEQVEAEKFKR
jgi:hypothetical protein